MAHPDSVRRVRPPKTTIPNTLAALPSNQYATSLSLTSGNRFLPSFAVFVVLLRADSGDDSTGLVPAASMFATEVNVLYLRSAEMVEVTCVGREVGQ